MSALESLDQQWGGRRDSGEDLLLVRKQVRVFGLERFKQGWHGIWAQANQLLRGAVAFCDISQLSDKSFCLTLF